MDIEVEIRAFIDEKKYNELLEFFSNNSKKIEEDEQETHYFNTKEDVRIQNAKTYSKIWMKKGKLHDDAREEIEIKLPKEDFPKLKELFKALGHETEIKWFRKRHTYLWGEISVMLDHTKGHGHIIELEKITNAQNNDKTILFLRNKLKELGVKETSKEEFNQRYEYYKNNWKELIKKKSI